MKHLLAALGLAAALIMSPAAHAADPKPQPAAAPEKSPAADARAKAKVSEAARADKASGEPMSDYRIGPLDLIEVKVLFADEISRAVRVDSQGNISLPLIGVIRAAGLTSFDLEQAVTQKLARDLIQDPQVSVFIKEFTSLRTTVQGAVTRAGLYDFQGRATLLQAISMAGGLTEKANEQRVKVIRHLATSGSETLEFNLESIRLNKINDPVLQNADIVVVEENNPIGVQGSVRKTGNYYTHGSTMTLTQAISQAEGLNDFADPSDIRVLSTVEGGRQVTVVYDLDKIRSGKIGDPELHPGDLVLVESSGAKSLIYGITNTLRGFVSPIR